MFSQMYECTVGKGMNMCLNICDTAAYGEMPARTISKIFGIYQKSTTKVF